MAAPKGNRNAAKAKVWSAAVERALDRRVPADKRIKAIDELADKLLDLCMDGDLNALKELGDRLEGKVQQRVELAGDPDAPLGGKWEVEIVRAAQAAPEDSGET